MKSYTTKATMSRYLSLLKKFWQTELQTDFECLPYQIFDDMHLKVVGAFDCAICHKRHESPTTVISYWNQPNCHQIVWVRCHGNSVPLGIAKFNGCQLD